MPNLQNRKHHRSQIPRGPKDQKNSRFRSGLKISSENEIFERATHRGPIFGGEIETSRLKFSSEIKNFDRDQKFRSGSNFFDRWALWVDLRKIELVFLMRLLMACRKMILGDAPELFDVLGLILLVKKTPRPAHPNLANIHGVSRPF